MTPSAGRWCLSPSVLRAAWSGLVLAVGWSGLLGAGQIPRMCGIWFHSSAVSGAIAAACFLAFGAVVLLAGLGPLFSTYLDLLVKVLGSVRFVTVRHTPLNSALIMPMLMATLHDMSQVRNPPKSSSTQDQPRAVGMRSCGQPASFEARSITAPFPPIRPPPGTPARPA